MCSETKEVDKTEHACIVCAHTRFERVKGHALCLVQIQTSALSFCVYAGAFKGLSSHEDVLERDKVNRDVLQRIQAVFKCVLAHYCFA